MDSNKTILEDLYPKYLYFSDSFMESRRLEHYPMLHVEALQHVSAMASGILQQLEQWPDILTKLPPAEIKKLADRIGAPDCRYSLYFVIVILECSGVICYHSNFSLKVFSSNQVRITYSVRKIFIDFFPMGMCCIFSRPQSFQVGIAVIVTIGLQAG
jgi:hypothetical protein